jgi:hypothetical protein
VAGGVVVFEDGRVNAARRVFVVPGDVSDTGETGKPCLSSTCTLGPAVEKLNVTDPSPPALGPGLVVMKVAVAPEGYVARASV